MPGLPNKKNGIVQELIVLPKETGKHNSDVYQKKSLERIIESLDDIVQNIVNPLWYSNIENIESAFNYYVLLFEFKSKSLLKMLLEYPNPPFPLNYENIKDELIKRETSDIQSRILQIYAIIAEHDEVLLWINNTNPQKMEEILKIIDIKDMQKNVYSSLLSLFCILFHPLDEINQGKKIKFINIGEMHSSIVQEYIHAISIMFNPNDIQVDDFIKKNVKMANLIGKYLITQLSEEFRKINFGKFIAIDYQGTVLASGNTLEELDNHILSKGMTENYYVARLGHDAISYL